MKPRKLKKLICTALSAAMLASVMPIGAGAAASAEDFLLFAMNFDESSDEAQVGTAECTDITFAESDNGTTAAVLNGTSSYISAMREDGTPLLRGTDSATISMRAKLEQPSTTNGWYFYTSQNDSAQVNSTRSYVGMYYSGSNGSIVAERFRDDNGTPTITADTEFDTWYDVTYIMDGYLAEVYVDGEFVGSADYESLGDDHILTTILGSGDDIVTYFGKANWGGGEYAKGMFDDIAVYSFAPAIDLGDLSNVQSDLNLPTASEDTDGYTIEWTSSDPDVISTDGKVTRPTDSKEVVTLTATITFGDKVLTREFEATVRGTDYYDMILNISDEAGVDIQDNMFGLFFEDINYAADGGLYAEMVENRSFEQVSTISSGKTVEANPGYAWEAVAGTMEYKTDTPLNENNPTYLEFTGTEFKNSAYEGMYIESGKEYNVSFWAKSDSYSGAVGAKTQSGTTVGFEGIVAESISDTWTKYEATLTAENSVRYSDFMIELDTSGTVDFDMISVMSADALYGVFRTDLAEKLKALNPGFLRFPGGCIVEGYNLEDRYQWKNSVGPVEERVQNWNRWAADTGYVNYNQTLGLGFYEYFLLCEYLDCDALPVLSVGIPCEYQGGWNGTGGVEVYNADGSYTDEFYAYIQDALDLIEFANGGTDTEWGALRAEMGHEEPFGLTMIGIGNEQWAIDGNDWYARYEAFEEEIHKAYPEMKLISTSGPSSSGTSFDDAWAWIRENQAENADFTYAVDEHYYMSPAWFLANAARYDDYDRNVKVFAGEYAAHTTLTSDAAKKNNLESAIAEAAFMTGLERNADVVYMASYAPLFARIGYNQWAPDMIWFDDVTSYATPNYYVQSMYSNNIGDYTLSSQMTTDDDIYQTVSYDEQSGDIIVKLVNPYNFDMRSMIYVDESFALTGKATEIVLTGEADTDCNSIDEPYNIVPTESEIDVSNAFDYIIGANSFVVLRIATSGNNLVSVKSFTQDGSAVSYELETSGEFDSTKYDVLVGAYNADGKLCGVSINKMSGTIETGSDESCDIKVMVL